jgi:hypothetical protein
MRWKRCLGQCWRRFQRFFAFEFIGRRVGAGHLGHGNTGKAQRGAGANKISTTERLPCVGLAHGSSLNLFVSPSMVKF